MGHHAEKIQAIQLMRAAAASVVAVSHMAFAFANHIGPGLGLPHLAKVASAAGQHAVAVFFVVSGFIMVTSSRSLFGRKGSARIFWTRRAVRIMPIYWVSSLVLLAVFLLFGISFNTDSLIFSFLLIPFDTEEFFGRPVFFLWPAWTLFYEMVFYLLFGIGIAFERRLALVVTAVFIIALIVIGQVADLRFTFLISLTRPVLFLFIGGMALAVFRERSQAFPAWFRYLAALLSILAYATIPKPIAPETLGLDYLLWTAAPSFLLAIALLGGPVSLPFFPTIDRLGEASYALYLIHVPLAHAWINIFPLRLGAWPFLISLVTLAYGLSLIVFLYLERPMTNWLNRLLIHRASKDKCPQQPLA